MKSVFTLGKASSSSEEEIKVNISTLNKAKTFSEAVGKIRTISDKLRSSPYWGDEKAGQFVQPRTLGLLLSTVSEVFPELLELVYIVISGTVTMYQYEEQETYLDISGMYWIHKLDTKRGEEDITDFALTLDDLIRDITGACSDVDMDEKNIRIYLS